MSETTRSLRIAQLNVNKSNTSQSALLHSVADFDIVALQEPHIDFLKNTCASQQWRVIYPARHKDSPSRTRSITLINTRIATNGWTAIAVDDPDITAVTLEYDTGLLHIFNVYNPQDSQLTLRSLTRATRKACAGRNDQLDAHKILANFECAAAYLSLMHQVHLILFLHQLAVTFKASLGNH